MCAMKVLPRPGSPTMTITKRSPCVPESLAFGGMVSCGEGLSARPAQMRALTLAAAAAVRARA